MKNINDLPLYEDEYVHFAKTKNDEFYHEALLAYQKANEVVELAKQERLEAAKKIAMMVKLRDLDEFIDKSLDPEKFKGLTAQEKLNHLIRKGRYVYGQSQRVFAN